MPNAEQRQKKEQGAQGAHALEDRGDRLAPQERQERKQQVLTRGTPSITRSVAEAVVIKDENVFFLSQPNGEIPYGGKHGFGLYYHDTRYLNGYELKLVGTAPNVLVSNAAPGFMAVFQLTNPDVETAEGEHIRRETIGGKWERVLDASKLALHDLFTFQNYGLRRLEFPLTLTFRAGFGDIFAVRGLLPEQLGKLQPPRWEDEILTFAYYGADGIERSLAIQFSPNPESKEATAAHFRLALEPGESTHILVSLRMAESPRHATERANGRSEPPDLQSIEAVVQRSTQEWVSRRTQVRSDSAVLNRTMERSLRDLHMLKSKLGDDVYLAAGLPWFGTLFGRDSLITALQMLAYDPEISDQTLRLLAKYQGDRVDAWRDEQPGKILHELRVGEFTRVGEIPYDPYYGTVDATLLFLILLGQHARWTGSLSLFEELRDNVERALDWMARYGDENADGYIDYKSVSAEGLINQGWKDSGDAIVNDDGSLATPPIELAEVQGYAYLARLEMADLFQRCGEPGRAGQLRREAQALKERFNRDFWLEDKGFFALALQRGSRPCAVMSSNPGQALWTGICDSDKARKTVKRLMAEDMWTGWGIRTLSSTERRYNPIGYHLGTVWPHDNAIIAAGFRRYAFDDEACRVFAAMLDAASHFEHYRLPELFGGFPREEYHVPVHYPVANHPQAWAAGSTPFLVTVMLGLEPEGFEQRLRIVRPTLPDFVERLEMCGLQVGSAATDLRFERTTEGNIAVNVLRIEGPLEILVEPTRPIGGRA